MHQAITNNRRRVPVPRQAVRLIAGGAKASVIATMLGHLIRCLYYRDQHCRSGGWCKASWIAEVFGINLRSVKAARKHLVEIGWLQTFPTPQRLCNRWGHLYADQPLLDAGRSGASPRRQSRISFLCITTPR